ncbi:MAG TPA: hypothetical protein DD670_07740 [Planctomycetaceae bacterium]|nr:hypothetical protein [Planctomycetaceae bacterium]
MKTCRAFLRLVLTLTFVVSLIGCGSKLPFDAAQVTGTVTFRGKPLEHGEIVFLPMEGTPGPQAVGTIQADGTFEMRSGNLPGVALGTHRVTVHCRGELPPEQATSLALPQSLIPEKYGVAETSPLIYEVKNGEKHVYNIDLQ